MKKLLSIILFLILPTISWADSKLNALPNNGSPATSDLTYEVQSSTDYYVNWAQIFSLMASGSYTWSSVQNYTSNVGIGSSNPSQSLDVQGTIKSLGYIDSGLTASSPVISNGSKLLSSGTYSGNTTTIGTTSGSLTSGHCVQIDANGNLVDAGGSCTTGGGGGTVSSGTPGQEAVYTGTTTVGSGVITDNGNIGVSTTNPGQKLDVAGTVRAINFSGLGTSLTGVPISTGISGLGTWVATFLATPSSANLATAVTDETGSGALAFGTNATFVNPALGTPASGVATNLTGTASGLTSGTVTTNANLTGPITSSGNATSVTSQTGTGTTFVMQAGNPNFIGNVGIGSATPGQLLDVQGTIRSLGAVFTNPGNVGIGSINPGTSLDVKGTVRALGYNLATTTTIGFVLTAIDSTGDVGFSASSGGSGTPSGISSQFQYNLSNAFAGANVYQSGGNVGIGTATPGQLLDVQGTIRTNTSFISTASGLSSFTGGNVGIGSVNPGQILDVNGTVRMSGAIFDTGITTDATKTDATLCEDTTTHQFYSGSGTLGICLGTSSARYKHNINTLGLGLSSINQLQPVTFFYNNGYGDNGARLQYGLLAEDVVKIIPNLVALDQNKQPNSVDLLGMVPILINSIKTQQKEIFLLMLGLFTFFVFLVFKK